MLWDHLDRYRPTKYMMEKSFLLTMMVILTMTPTTSGFSGGPPDSACNDMTPQHGFRPQTRPSPFKVAASDKEVSPGGTITVSISDPNSNRVFKGFFIRASQNGRFIGGTFQQENGVRLRCAGTAIAHASANPKQAVQVKYTVPRDAVSGDIIFLATVVENKSTFWVKMLADPIKVSLSTTNTDTDTNTNTNGNTNNNNNNGNTATVDPNNSRTNANHSVTVVKDNTGSNGSNAPNPWQNSGPQNTVDQDSGPQRSGEITLHSDCGKTRGCFHDCDNGVSCSFVVYWKPMNNSVLFRMVYKPPSRTDKWLALALSHDQLMGDDSVMECVMDTDEVLVKTSYNTGQYNDYPDDKHAALSHYEGFVKDGVLGCQFVRKISYPREPKVFDLRSNYYLFIAMGEAVAGNKFPHLYEHLPVISRNKISLLRVKEVEKGPGVLYPMVKTHGIAMILAWVLFANIGVFISRHGRNMFSSTTPFGTDVWFHIHRFCMTMTLFLTLVGFLLILIESRGRSHIPQLPGKSYVILHPPLGLIVIILTIVNPLMALYRPALSSPSRPLFRWTHWGFGVFAWFVSFIVLAIGLNLQKAHAEIESVYLIFAFMGYSLAMEILIRVLPFTCGAVGYCCKKITCGRHDSYDFNIELRSSEVASMSSSVNVSSNKGANHADLERIANTENTVITLMILVHILACTGFTAGVLYFALRTSVNHIIFNH